VRIAFVSTLSCLLLAGCDPAPQTRADVPAHRLGDSFTMRPGETGRIDGGIRIAFVGMREDSRCPKTVTCIWQGAATVRFATHRADAAQTPHEFDLATAPESARGTEYQGYRVELLDVAASEPYRVTLRVTRAP
jgi:hypothetical protein